MGVVYLEVRDLKEEVSEEKLDVYLAHIPVLKDVNYGAAGVSMAHRLTKDRGYFTGLLRVEAQAFEDGVYCVLNNAPSEVPHGPYLLSLATDVCMRGEGEDGRLNELHWGQNGMSVKCTGADTSWFKAVFADRPDPS